MIQRHTATKPRLSIGRNVVLGLGLALLGWLLAHYAVTLPLGLGLRLQVGEVAGILAACAVGNPLWGAVAGLMVGSATFSSLWLPNAIAHVAAFAWVGWLFPRSRTVWRQAGLAFLSQLVLSAVAAGVIGLTALDGKLFLAEASVLGIALLPGAIGSAILLPLLLRDWDYRYLIGAAVLLLGVGLTLWGRSTIFPPVTAVTPVDGLYAGVAVADITPAKGEQVFLGGYGGRTGPAQGSLDSLNLRALVLQEGTTRVTFITLDAVGIGNRLEGRIRAAAGGGNVLISASHSHAAPDLQGIWGGAAASYEDRLVQAAGKAVGDAVKQMKPATATAASSLVMADIQQNRRDWNQTDRRLSALRLTTRDGKPIATLVNYALHATVLPRENMAASSDFVGGLRQTVEEKLGGVTLFVNGAEGDVTPRAEQNVVRDAALAKSVGAQIGNYAVEILGGNGAMKVPPGAHLRIEHQALELPLANWGFQLLASLNVLRYQMGLDGAIPVMQTRVSVVRLGDIVTMLTAPGEVTTRLANRIEEHNRVPAPFFLGLTNDTLGYLLPRDEWQSGRNENYEESVSVGPQAGELYARKIEQMLQP